MTKFRLGLYLWVVGFLISGLAAARADSVQTINLPVNDLVYDAVTRKIYASVPSSAPNNRGNTITVVDPFTGAIGASVFIGSEPNVLALSDDGRYLYVGLEGAGAIRRFEIATLTAGLQFSLGRDSYTGTLYAADIEVQPGNANVIAVARRNKQYSPSHAGVAIFDNGVQRSATTPEHTGSNVLEWGATANRLYGLDSASSSFGFRRLDVAANGVTEVDSRTTAIYGFNVTMRFANGEIYASDGTVLNAESRVFEGSFPSIDHAQAVCPDAARNRVAFFLGNRLVICDRPTFRYVGELAVSNNDTTGFGASSRLVRWGDDGLAFINGGRIQLARTSLWSAPLPDAKPLPINPEVNGLRRVDLSAADIIYDAARGEILAAVSSITDGYENSLTPLNPLTGQVGQPTWIGAAPWKLAKADDGKTFWAALQGQGAVRRYDASSRSIGTRISLGVEEYPYGQLYAGDIVVQPGHPGVVAVMRHTSGLSYSHRGVAIFDDGVQRPQTTVPGMGGDVLEWSDSPTNLYGFSQDSARFNRLEVTATGVAVISGEHQNNSSYKDILYSNGLVYFTNGLVIDAQSGQQLGIYGDGGHSVCVDESSGRVFFITTSDPYRGPVIVTAYDRDKFTPIASRSLSGITGTVGTLIRWGEDGLAFINRDYYVSDGENAKVWLLRTSLVADVPRLTLQIAPAEAHETAGSNVATATLTRNGGFETPLTVQLFANRPGDVEIPATVTIPAGEAQVTFPIGVKNNNVAEGTRLVLITGRATGWIPGTGRLTIYDDEARLSLSITPLSFTENAGAQAAKATVTRNTSTEAPLRVQLSSTDRSEASVPGAVVIPAGASSVTFFVAAVNDEEVDGPQAPIISAYLTGYAPGRQQVEVRDEDRAALSITLSKPAISESGGPYAVLLTVTRNAKLSEALTVTLQNNLPDRIKVPASVTIAAGARRASVWVAAIDDSIMNENQTASLRAVATFFAPAQTQLTIQDDD